jgi:hypothetical protein
MKARVDSGKTSALHAINIARLSKDINWVVCQLQNNLKTIATEGSFEDRLVKAQQFREQRYVIQTSLELEIQMAIEASIDQQGFDGVSYAFTRTSSMSGSID